MKKLLTLALSSLLALSLLAGCGSNNTAASGSASGSTGETVTLKVGSQENTVVFARWAIRSVENKKTENDSQMPEV